MTSTFRSDSKLLLTWRDGLNLMHRFFQVSDPAWRELHVELARTQGANVRIRYLRGEL